MESSSQTSYGSGVLMKVLVALLIVSSAFISLSDNYNINTVQLNILYYISLIILVSCISICINIYIYIYIYMSSTESHNQILNKA